MENGMLSYVEDRQEEILSYLTHLVAIESPSQDKQSVDRVISDLEGEYRNIGFTTRRIPGQNYADHLVADSPANNGPRVLLVGHADTVYPQGTLDSMPIRREGDTLFGPGVMDMKGGLTTMLFGIKSFLHVRGNLQGNIRVVINSDEEPGSPTSRPFWPELTSGVDWAFVFEWGPEADALLLKRKGVGIFHVEAKGISAHAGEEPEKGANAILAVADKIVRLQALTDFKGGTTVNVGVVEGGTRPYVVPDSARAEVDVRVPNRHEQKRILLAMKEIIERKDVPGTCCTLQGEFHRPPLEPLSGVDNLKNIIAEESQSLDLKIRWLSAGAVSDANNISAAGVPTIDGMGPYGCRAHSPDEFMNIPSLFQKTVLLSGILDRLIGKQACCR